MNLSVQSLSLTDHLFTDMCADDERAKMNAVDMTALTVVVHSLYIFTVAQHVSFLNLILLFEQVVGVFIQSEFRFKVIKSDKTLPMISNLWVTHLFFNPCSTKNVLIKFSFLIISCWVFFYPTDLIHCTNELNVSIPHLADTLLERTASNSWIVVFKALITTHHLMMYGNEVS